MFNDLSFGTQKQKSGSRFSPADSEWIQKKHMDVVCLGFFIQIGCLSNEHPSFPSHPCGKSMSWKIQIKTSIFLFSGLYNLSFFSLQWIIQPIKSPQKIDSIRFSSPPFNFFFWKERGQFQLSVPQFPFQKVCDLQGSHRSPTEKTPGGRSLLLNSLPPLSACRLSSNEPSGHVAMDGTKKYCRKRTRGRPLLVRNWDTNNPYK